MAERKISELGAAVAGNFHEAALLHIVDLLEVLDADKNRRATIAQLRTAIINANSVNTAAITDAAVTGAKLANGYMFVQRVIFTASGTFSKASYPWLRAIEVHVVSGGGGGAGVTTTGAGQCSIGGGGGGGTYCNSIITNIAGLAASETVTVGAGGAGGTGGADGGVGGQSNFGTLVVAGGAAAGKFQAAVTAPSRGGLGGTMNLAGAVGDIRIVGQTGGTGVSLAAAGPIQEGVGGAASGPFGSNAYNAGKWTSSMANGAPGSLYGTGGGGSGNLQNQGSTRNGGAGGQGIVVLDLYA